MVRLGSRLRAIRHRSAAMRRLSALAAGKAKSTRPAGASLTCSIRPLPFKVSAFGSSKVELLHVERIALEAEPRVEPARRECWAAQFADAQGHAQVVVAELMRTGSARHRPNCPLPRDGSQDRQSGPSPIMSRRSRRSLSRWSSIRLALTAMQAEAAGELGSAQLARGIGEFELAVADGGVGGRDVKSPAEACPEMSRSPAAQRVERLELRSFKPDRPGEDRAELASAELPRGLDAVVAGKHRLQPLDHVSAPLGRRAQDRPRR